MTHTQPGMRSVSVYVLLEVMSKQQVFCRLTWTTFCVKKTLKGGRGLESALIRDDPQEGEGRPV